VIAAEQDLPLMIGILEIFTAHERPDRLFMQGVLRDGLVDARAVQVEGLQPALLRGRSRFSEDDFQSLGARLLALSTTSQLRTDDFADRLHDQPTSAVDLTGITLPAVVHGWYVEPAGATSPAASR
jgi:hypothetical protein